ncbi:molybdenum cofactor guanylyltransferase [Pseudanabaena sp. PCC 6802]|uniref:molybdenum cofactor guanylyltransferase n=1 Tax=Pseudanabaena sp. PCC 6802 TaxID=118173 RepID=UPI0003479134|nr:molybdenum cofactor guanylyltransferase [Pseudanabaena sp. PCC 6802]
MPPPCLDCAPPDLCAIVLAGGRSSRMGQDKALIPINGIPLLQRTCDVAAACCDRAYVVTGRSQDYQHLPLARQCQFLSESNPEGPLVGFYVGLRQLDTQAVLTNCDWILLLACDLPNLQASELQRWASQLPQLSETVMAYLPKYSASGTNPSHKQWEPLCGFYRRDCLPSLKGFIADGGRSFQRWLDRIQVAEILNVNPLVLFNCNTPQDFSEL